MSTTTRERVQCFRCKYNEEFITHDGRNGDVSLESAARVAGWRVWPSDDDTPKMLCPLCAGTATDEQVQEIAGWDAECTTCGATMSEDEYDNPGPITKDAAQSWASRHECDPETHVIAPQSPVVAGRAS